MKKHRKKKYRILSLSMTPTPERATHDGGVIPETIAWDRRARPLITRFRAVWTCPLDAYRDHGVISEAEHKAGMRFGKAYYRAVLSGGAKRNRLSNRTIDTHATISEKILKQAFRILAPFTKRAVIDICGHEEPARDERKLHELKTGLGQLAVQWNLAAAEVTKRR